jgi:hypothetical protein
MDGIKIIPDGDYLLSINNSFINTDTLKMKGKIVIIFIAISIFANIKSNAQTMMDTLHCPYDCCRPDGHAPLGIMTDHVHGKGQWTIDYTYMNTTMKGNLMGTKSVDDNTIFKTFAMAPDKMTMEMHMFMLMYSITDNLTVMGVMNYISNNMVMSMDSFALNSMRDMPGMVGSTVNNASMNTTTSGMGDAKLYALYKIMDINRQRLIIGAGLSIPTGSITERGSTLIGVNQILPYCMQLGSGTYDFMPSINYIGQSQYWSYGGVLNATIRTNTNTEGYSLGNQYSATAWLAYKFCHLMSASMRIEGVNTSGINGYDPNIERLSPNDPSSNTSDYGGKAVNAYIGLNFYKDKCSFKGLRLELEYGIPVYQNLNGTQMSLQRTFLAGCLYAF